MLLTNSFVTPIKCPILFYDPEPLLMSEIYLLLFLKMPREILMCSLPIFCYIALLIEGTRTFLLIQAFKYLYLFAAS